MLTETDLLFSAHSWHSSVTAKSHAFIVWCMLGSITSMVEWRKTYCWKEQHIDMKSRSIANLIARKARTSIHIIYSVLYIAYLKKKVVFSKCLSKCFTYNWWYRRSIESRGGLRIFPLSKANQANNGTILRYCTVSCWMKTDLQDNMPRKWKQQEKSRGRVTWEFHHRYNTLNNTSIHPQYLQWGRGSVVAPVTPMFQIMCSRTGMYSTYLHIRRCAKSVATAFSTPRKLR